MNDDIEKIQRQLKRNRKKLQGYLNSISTLSKHGYQQLGYLKGMIRIQEDTIDLLKEREV